MEGREGSGEELSGSAADDVNCFAGDIEWLSIWVYEEFWEKIHLILDRAGHGKLRIATS